ncbi:radical SAM protein [bacterium]|nr:radical SAM protein [bacterium]
MKAKFFSRRTPLMVSWFLTYRCNKRCIYCDSWKIKTEELDTKKILNIIDEMAEAGTKLLHFTGGDPLLKDDIGLIIEHCKQKKIITNINSNPVSIFKKIEELENVNLLTLSFDGPEEIHDLIRGRGSFRILMAAVKVIKQSKKKLRFITVLSKYNLNTISYILKKAQELNVPVVFQPARKCTLTGTETNPIAPTEKDYKKVILGLIIEKKRNKYIINSIPGLRHLYNWPSSTKIKCINSFIICRLQPNGDMYGCGSNLNSNMNVPNCLKLGFKKSFKDLIPINCETCWCASFVELNHLFSLNIKTMLNVLKLHVTNSLL